MVAIQSEPRLRGSIIESFFLHKSREPYEYRLTNIGSDTAWSVFARGQFVILCDTLVIYPETYLFGAMYAGGALRGDFSRWNPIAPAKTREWWFGKVGKDIIKLSKLLGGIILVEVDLVYWSDSPVKRYGEVEYFIYKWNTSSIRGGCKIGPCSLRSLQVAKIGFCVNLAF